MIQSPILSDCTHFLEGQKMFQILAKAKSLERIGRKVIHFEIGDPDFETPNNIIEGCINALRGGFTHYCPSSGLDLFKEASAEMILRSRGFKPQLQQILPTAGANIQIYYSILCTVNPKEEVIIFDPSFVSYSSIINLVGARAVRIPLKEQNSFKVDPSDISNAITKNTRMIILNSPQNPTGSVISEKVSREIFALAQKHNLFLVSDEVYGRMIYDNCNTSFFSPCTLDKCLERTILLHSLSKSYAMTGWRIGAVTGPIKLIEKMSLLLETTSSCVSPFIQIAAAKGLLDKQNEISERMTEFKERRDLMVSLLNRIKGISCTVPDGAFYVFANISKTGLSSQRFSDLILENTSVATCPGIFFGDNGEGFVRFCFANSKKNITEGLKRIEQFFR